MVMYSTYDVIVLGGGAGGVAAAIRASQLGGRVALIESQFLGGVCMNRGCVPFGHMMAASRILGNLSLGREMGLNFSEVSTDFKRLKKRQGELIEYMRQGVKSTLYKNKVEIMEDQGRIAGKGKVEVNGKALSCRCLILASGAKWIKPDFPGADLEGVTNSDGLLIAKDLPKRALVFGSDPRLIEITQFLHRFGSQVSLVTQERSILPHESKTIRSRLAKSLKNEGISIYTRAEILGLKKEKGGFKSVLKLKEREETLVVDRIITFQRRAALEGLGLETVGLDEKAEYIRVNEGMETAVEGIYAIGDVAAPETRHYSHSASAGGIVAAENAMGMKSVFDRRTMCRVLFAQPQVACVGLTGKEAKQAGYDVIEGTAPLSMNPFGMIISQSEGIVEVVAEKEHGEVLGVHFIGEGAAEMAGQAVLAIQIETTLEELTRAVFPHPTLSESLVEAARDALGRAIYLPS